MTSWLFSHTRRIGHASAVALLLLAAVAGGLLTRAPAHANEVHDCTNPHSNCFTLAYTDGNGQSHPLTDNSGHPVSNAGHVQSGQTVTVEGWNWKLNQRYEIWLSQPFSDLSQEPNIDECYIRVDSERSPSPTSLADHPNAPGTFRVNFTVPEIAHTPEFANGAYFIVEVGGPGIGCIGGNGSQNDPNDLEGQALELPFQAFPTPACVPALNAPCLDVSPGVVYPGGTVSVAGQGWNAKAGTVGLYLGIGSGQLDCSVPLQAPAINADGTFSTTIAAPPLPTLPVGSDGQLPTSFRVFAVSPAPAAGSCATTGALEKSAPLYVSQPTLSVTSSVHSDDTVTIQGTHWLAADPATHLAAPVAISVFVGNDSNFSCGSAKVFTTTSDLGDAPNGGTFTVTFPAERVNNDLTKQVRVVALPVGATLASACDSAAGSACAAAQSSASSCPLMAVVTTLKILPIVVPTPNWLYLLLPLLLLLLLLPLFFWLGKREEDEILVTEQDITVEREIANAASPTKYADATFARTIRITRERINPRTGKVKEAEVEEYDVFRDAQGKEVRRLRPHTAAVPVSPAPATTV